MPYHLETLARRCIALTWVYVGLTAVLLFHTLWELSLGHGLVPSSYDFDPDGTGGQYLTWAIAAATLFILALNGTWLYRATANAQARAGASDAISPRMAVGWYVVPIANLWMPYRAMRQIWQATVGLSDGDASPRLLRIWWSAWLVSILSSEVGRRLGQNGDTYEDYVNSLWPYVISEPSDIVAGILFATIIRRITDGLSTDRLAETFA